MQYASQQKLKNKRYGIALKFHRFMLDPSAAPMYGIGESRLAARKYVCQWSFVCKPNAPPLGQTPAKPFRRLSGAHCLEWDGVAATVALEEHTLSLFNERVLLLQIVEVPDTHGSSGVVMASGTIDPGVFVRKPAKEYAVKLENNFVAVGKLFFNMQVDNLESPIFAEKTRIVSNLTLQIEKIVADDEIKARGAESSAPSKPNLFSSGQDYYFKIKYQGQVHRTPTTQCETPHILRWNYVAPLDVNDENVAQDGGAKAKFALMCGTAQLSVFAIDMGKLLQSTCKQFSVPITVLKVGDKVYNAMFDLAVDRSEMMDLSAAEKHRYADPNQTTVAGHSMRSVSRATTMGGPSVSPQPRIESPSQVHSEAVPPQPQHAPPEQSSNGVPEENEQIEYRLPSMFRPAELARSAARSASSDAPKATAEPPATESPTLKERMARVRLVKPTNSAITAMQQSVSKARSERSESTTSPRASLNVADATQQHLVSPSRAVEAEKRADEAEASRQQWEKKADALRLQLEEVEAQLGSKVETLEAENTRMRTLLEKQDNEIKTLRQQNIQLMRRMQEGPSSASQSRAPSTTQQAPSSMGPRRATPVVNGPAGPSATFVQSAEPLWATQANGPTIGGPGSRSSSRQPGVFEASPSIVRPTPRQPPATRSGMLFVGDDED